MAAEGSVRTDAVRLASMHTQPETFDLRIQDQADHTSVEQSLPPCDRGAEAWRLLMSAFVFEALLWGTCR